eukprot:3768119-Alexandrium_andersonii.AAC.1
MRAHARAHCGCKNRPWHVRATCEHQDAFAHADFGCWAVQGAMVGCWRAHASGAQTVLTSMWACPQPMFKL